MPRSSHQQTVFHQWLILKGLPTHRPGITAQQMMYYLETEGISVTADSIFYHNSKIG